MPTVARISGGNRLNFLTEDFRRLSECCSKAIFKWVLYCIFIMRSRMVFQIRGLKMDPNCAGASQNAAFLKYVSDLRSNKAYPNCVPKIRFQNSFPNFVSKMQPQIEFHKGVPEFRSQNGHYLVVDVNKESDLYRGSSGRYYASFIPQRSTLLLLIFTGLTFRDFRDFQKIAKLKTRENVFFGEIAKIKSREICLFHFREIKFP